MYPNWFIDRLADQQIAQALGGSDPRKES